MTQASPRTYPRNSPQAAGRIVAMALFANGEIKSCEWARLGATRALERLGLTEHEWYDLLDDLCSDLLACAQPGQDSIVDTAALGAWLRQVDDPRQQALVVELGSALIEADGDVDPGESVVLRAALDQWVLPMELQARVEPLVYGLDFQVLPRRAASAIP